ncbi:hypothetical protein TorRG33x02_328750, partial [Trema orientale]
WSNDGDDGYDPMKKMTASESRKERERERERERPNEMEMEAGKRESTAKND